MNQFCRLFLCIGLLVIAPRAFCGPSGIDKKERKKVFVISIGVSASANLPMQMEEYVFCNIKCPSCLTDASGLPAYLKQLKKQDNSIDTVLSWEFINTQKKLSDIEAQFDAIARISKPQDIFLFYYAGISWGQRRNEGTGGKEGYYMLNGDGKGYDPDFSFTLNWLKVLTDRLPATKQLIVFDTGVGEVIQGDFYRNFFNENAAAALFSKKDRIIICPEDMSADSYDSAGVKKGDMFKVISNLPAQYNVFSIFERRNTTAKNDHYKQFMRHWFNLQTGLTAQIKILREQDYLEVLTAIKPLSASSARGNIVLEKEKKVDSNFANRKKYALVIGTSTYSTDQWPTLRNAEADALAVSATLKQKGYLVTEMINRPLDDLLTSVFEISNIATNPFDQVVVFIAGHGYYDPVRKTGFIVAGDSKPIRSLSNPSPVDLKNYMDYTVLFNNLNLPNKAIIITDVCFGGTSVNASMQGKETVTPANDKTYQKNAYRKVLSSGVTVVDDFIKYQNGTVSAHSPFATALLQQFAANGNSLSFEKLVSGIAGAGLEVKPIEFSFGENVKPNEFIF